MGSPPEKLTTVVNYWPELPDFSESPSTAERRISRSAIYKLEFVKQLPAERFHLLTRRCRVDVVENLEWDTDDIDLVIKSLSEMDFHTAEWCRAGKKWLPCDSYVLRNFDEDEERNIDIYIKFAVSPEGDALLIVSCHLS